MLESIGGVPSPSQCDIGNTAKCVASDVFDESSAPWFMVVMLLCGSGTLYAHCAFKFHDNIFGFKLSFSQYYCC